jgi:hypothetical protein
VTAGQFSTAVKEINRGDPIASTLRFQFGNLEKTLSSKDAQGDLTQNRYFKNCNHRERMANRDRPLNQHGLWW